MTDSPPPITRRSSGASTGDGLDADLIGAATDLDGAPVDALSYYPTSTLTDLVHTFFTTAPRLDIETLDRKLKQASEKVRQKVLRHDVTADGGHRSRSDRRAELKRLREKVSARVDKLSARWTEQKNVRLRDKLCFVVGVMNLVVSSLIFAYKPEWMPISYTIQTTYFLPLRVYSYTRQKFTYFLFDYCKWRTCTTTALLTIPTHPSSHCRLLFQVSGQHRKGMARQP